VSFNRVDDPSRPFLSFLNVRWVIAPPGYSPPPGWTVARDDRTGRLLENPNVLPRVFAPRGYFRELDRGRQLERLHSIADFGESGVAAEAGGDRLSNGEATVRILRYEPEAILVDIDARAPALVATSLTRWPGWKVIVDDRSVPVVGYNNAFIAFHVGAGHHSVRIAYEPEGVRAGLAISLATGALCLGFGLVSLRRRRLALRRGPSSKAERASEEPPPA
jgi:hypothetical protein